MHTRRTESECVCCVLSKKRGETASQWRRQRILYRKITSTQQRMEYVVLEVSLTHFAITLSVRARSKERLSFSGALSHIAQLKIPKVIVSARRKKEAESAQIPPAWKRKLDAHELCHAAHCITPSGRMHRRRSAPDTHTPNSHPFTMAEERKRDRRQHAQGI